MFPAAGLSLAMSSAVPKHAESFIPHFHAYTQPLNHDEPEQT